MGYSGEQRLARMNSVKLPPLSSHGYFEYLEFSSLGLGLSEGEDLRAEGNTFFSFSFSAHFSYISHFKLVYIYQKCILFRGIFWRSVLVFVWGKDFILHVILDGEEILEMWTLEAQEVFFLVSYF